MEGPSHRAGNSADLYLPNYKLGKTLGSGSFSEVKIAEHILTGVKVAIKTLNRHEIKNKEMEEKVTREIKIMRLFVHPHIVRLYEVIETPDYIYIVMEYAKGGDLFDYIMVKGRLQEDEARNFFQQIISGVECCHRYMVVHRDLKPENLLLDSKHHVKIADFGLSNIMRDGHFLKTRCGSPNYAAPEVISDKLYAGPEVDIWSCGVILYALLCGTLPFGHESIPMLFKKIKAGIYTIPRYLSAGAQDLISGMLLVDPMKRMTAPEICRHPWFQAHLPLYLAVPLPDTARQAKKIDEEILQELVKMGFERSQLIESLCSRMQNLVWTLQNCVTDPSRTLLQKIIKMVSITYNGFQATVTYYLLLDDQFQKSNGYLGVEFQKTMEYSFSCMHPKNPSSAVAKYLPRHVDSERMSLRSQFQVDRKWKLGIQSRAHPHAIMTVVLKALQELAVCWKKIGHYNMKCRWAPGTPRQKNSMINGPVNNNHFFGEEPTINENDRVFNSQNVVKFEVQLYKTHEESYLVDLQRVWGPHLLFLDLCAALLAQLGVV